MNKKQYKQLSKRQVAVIDDLFIQNMDELEILRKHKLSAGIYRKWLADEAFVEELEFRIESARRQGAFIIARFIPLAAAKLVKLTECEKEETVRKACLDIISTSPDANRRALSEGGDGEVDEGESLDAELASKLLNALAEDE